MLNTNVVHSSWKSIFNRAYQQISPDYLRELANNEWLPGPEKIFSAFSQPLSQIHYILVGESPYPRALSANGYAFWDAQVQELFSPTGLSRPVNRATSLRHLMKMMLVAEGLLSAKDTSQEAIANIDKTALIKTGAELFQNFLKKGFLLLNCSLVLSQLAVAKEAQLWQPFMEEIFNGLAAKRPDAKLILFGKIAEKIDKIPVSKQFSALRAEHPYNKSFVTNKKVLDFFAPLHLLRN